MKVTITFEVNNWSADVIESLVQERIDKGASLNLVAGPTSQVYAQPIAMVIEER